MSESATGRRGSGSALDLNRRPILVFWETTRACPLACRHCRASAIREPLPGELTPVEGVGLIDQLAGFGRPSPVLVLTGGDVLMRPDLSQLVRHARHRGLPVALAPTVSPVLGQRAAELRALGVSVASISLDGARAATHDRIRNVAGHFRETVDAIRLLRGERYTVQVNTVVMRENVGELAEIARIVRDEGAAIWEVFFLIAVGRAAGMTPLTAAENEDVCNLLFDASRYGFVVRAVEAPFFRRIVAWRRGDADEGDIAERFGLGPLYRRLAPDLRRRLGAPGDSRAQTKGTRDGKGVLFVGHDGTVSPAGFLPIPLGDCRSGSVPAIYRSHPLLRDIRAARFPGKCGRCEFADLCGGSRARAFATSADPLGDDPGCRYVPPAAS